MVCKICRKLFIIKKITCQTFPQDQQGVLQELYQMRYFDVFEINSKVKAIHWACFMCNHPERLSELLNDGYPEIAVSFGLLVFLAW